MLERVEIEIRLIRNRLEIKIMNLKDADKRLILDTPLIAKTVNYWSRNVSTYHTCFLQTELKVSEKRVITLLQDGFQKYIPLSEKKNILFDFHSKDMLEYLL